MNKNARKLLSLALASVLVLALAACGGGAPAPSGSANPTDAPPPAEDFFVKVATGQSGGTYYPIGIAMAQVFSDNIPGCVSSAMATGGSVDNIGLLQGGEAQLAMIMSTTCKEAYDGTGAFAGNPYEDLRAITALWENNIQLIVPNSITSVAQLEGKKFVVGANLSGTELDSRAVLGAFGLEYANADAGKNNLEAVYLDYTQGVDALKNGQVSGVLNNSHAPASTITDLLSTGDYHILEFTDEELEAILGANELYDIYTIPAGSYPNQDHDIKVPGYPVLLTCDASADADQIYTLLKAVFDHSDALINAHSAAKSITLENAVKGLIVPIHEGAERCFKEVGAM